MTDTKLSAMTENTNPVLEDLLYSVDDPGGTPVERKITVENVNMGLVLLKTVTEASAVASIDVEDWYSVDYDEYQIEVLNLLPATDTDILYMRMSTDGGSTYDSGANYGTAVFYIRDGADSNTLGDSSGANEILLSDGLSNTQAQGGVSGSFKFINPGSTIFYKALNFHLSMIHSTSDYLHNMIGTAKYFSTTAVNAFQFFMSSGNITGTVRVYGVKK